MTRTLSSSSTAPAKTSRWNRSRSRRRRKVGNPKRIAKAAEALSLVSVEERGSLRFSLIKSMRSLLFISLLLSLRPVLATISVFKTKPIDVWRPRNYTAVNDARTASVTQERCHGLEWDRLSLPAPDITDQYTLAQLARMAANAYALPGAPNWWDLDPMWSSVCILPSVNPLYRFNLTLRFTVVPNRVGESNRRLPRPRFRGSGQHHRRALDQGHHTERTHFQGR
jgi:hypothetical protein